MQSMEEIYQDYAKSVYRYLLALTHDDGLAEELTQETFYQAIRSSERYDGSCKISTWLCAIAKNVLLSHRRKHPPQDELLPQDVSVPSAEAEAVGAAGRMRLLRQIHALPEPYRELLYLRVFGGLSFREIGELLGRTENWARVSYYRGKEKLRKEVERDDEDPM